MSEKNDKPSEESAVDAVQEPAGEKPGSEESAVSPATQPDSGPSRPPSPPPPAAAKKGGSSIVGWLALLLVLALGGAAGWTVMQSSWNQSPVARVMNCGRWNASCRRR